MEQESGEGTNNPNYRFEIERTDSLEFTCNSVTGMGDESREQVVLSTGNDEEYLSKNGQNQKEKSNKSDDTT